jgi:hypothetical protein
LVCQKPLNVAKNPKPPIGNIKFISLLKLPLPSSILTDAPEAPPQT